ncbi:putative iron-only hydrogenase system regulator [Halobacteroides halobius DSM 5150]|uniref:Putative iron-only hydrogenase system regulator n=1 Tax=Halobacteroides halobius (strain ATCC 35273 / DSM 5150 / MD-1) TaxID=748449 RepID=L0K751_HALHC|nr:TM1266 family iron-only hydrogenase system putative regulator [Halobacteroides halobius]AGB40821.1 putative iron-only hydrogenase system regulator [Halobacteroides halobius DSM 5150]
MGQRIAVVGVIINNREVAAKKVNDILSQYGDIIVGRMGIPYQGKDLNIISLIVDGTNDQLGALAGKLGNIKGVKVKTMIAT